jgi:hypothetical protein
LGQIEETSFLGRVWGPTCARLTDAPVNVSDAAGVMEPDALEFKVDVIAEFMSSVVAQIRPHENMYVLEDIEIGGAPLGLLDKSHDEALL